MKYSLDTSAILDGWKRYYTPDVFHTVWRRLDYLITSGKVRVTEEVFHELEKQDDEVYKWVNSRQSRLVVPLDEPIQVEALRILETCPKLVNDQKNRHQADPWVIALASVNGCTVVSGEGRRSLKNPKVPDVCDDMGVRHLRLLDVFREEGFKF